MVDEGLHTDILKEYFIGAIKEESVDRVVNVDGADESTSYTSLAEPKVNVQVQAEADVDQGAPEHSYALVTPPSPGMEVSVGDVEDKNVSMEGNTSSGETQIPQKKKAKLAGNLVSLDNINIYRS